MPRLENIERFKEILYALGSEPQVSSRRAEIREDDLTPSADTAGAFAEESPDTAPETTALDLDDLLGQTSESPLPPPAAEGTADTETDDAAFGFDEPPSAGVEGMDLGGLFDEAPAEPATESPAEEPTFPTTGDEPEVFGGASFGAPPADESVDPFAVAEEPVTAETDAALGAEVDTGFGDVDFGAAETAAPASEDATGESFGDLGEGAFDTGGAEGDETAGPAPGSEPTGPLEPAMEAGDFSFPEGGFDAVEPAAGDVPEPSTTAEAGGEAEAPFETFGEEAAAFDTGGEEPSATGDEGGGALDTGDLETGAFDLGGFDTEPAAEAAGAPAGTESIDELAEGFSLQGLSDDLDQVPAMPETAVGAEGVVSESPTGGASGGEITLEDREFRALQRNLEVLPRNLKIAIETLVGEQGYTGEHLRPLLDMLVRGDSPKLIAAQVSKITGTTIRIPARFERQTGAEFEAERGSLAYLVRTTVLPILRTALLVAAALGIVVFAVRQFVVVPILAESAYNTGFRSLERGQYDVAGKKFEEAVNWRKVKRWYFRYAEGYIVETKYDLASGMYDRIDADFGYDKTAILDHARLQSTRLKNYTKAQELLARITDRDFFDRDALIANGDNYLEWARYAPEEGAEGEETRATLLEKARVEYARVLERHGWKNDVLFRMMLYFVRADRADEVSVLRAHLESDEDFEPDPDVYAEVGGYLLDQGLIEDARTVLLLANKASTLIPEIDYNLARLYRELDDPSQEGVALRNTLDNLGVAEKTPERIFLEIDTHRRMGDWMYREERVSEAATEYEEAIALTETALADRTQAPRPELGLAYAGLGNVRYYEDIDYERALELYESSRRLGLVDRNVDYRIGYIRYAQGEYEMAVDELVELQREMPLNPNVLFATATALYQRGDYFAAEGYYRRLVDRLLVRRDAIIELNPVTNPDHFTLVNLLLKARNNLGITYYQEGRMRGGRGRELTRALVEITDAAQYLDVLARDPETLERSEAKNLAYLNANTLQHPGSGFEPSIYDRIPLDPEADRF